jgi:hypothetical protein
LEHHDGVFYRKALSEGLKKRGKILKDRASEVFPNRRGSRIQAPEDIYKGINKGSSSNVVVCFGRLFISILA